MQPSPTDSIQQQEEADRQPSRSDASSTGQPPAGDGAPAPAGSPLAPVMKQFQKTEAESSGKR